MKKKTNAFKNKGQKTAMSVVKKVPPRRIVEYYYFPEGDVSARNILQAVGADFAETGFAHEDLQMFHLTAFSRIVEQFLGRDFRSDHLFA